MPTRRILEIAPGFGRWTRFLQDLCEHYEGVDLSPACVDHCRQAFISPHASFHLNNGKDLDMIADHSIDFVFSFDSLVHADLEVLSGYTRQILSKLCDEGVAFIHHSNLANHDIEPVQAHMRDKGVSWQIIRALVLQAGGEVLRQETVRWDNIDALDCITLFCKAGAFQPGPDAAIDNPHFMDEARYIGRFINPWSFTRKPKWNAAIPNERKRGL